MNIALVTGATGFVGSRLVESLINDGWAVHVITREGSDLTELENNVKNVCIHLYDGTSSGMKKIILTSQPDVVFHLASMFLSEHTSEQINDLISSNIIFGSQLLESMVSCGVYNFVNTGTSWQHYESMEYNPVNFYAATKQAFEDILKFYVEAKGVKAITLKLFDTYGPNDPRSKLLSLLLKVSETDEELVMSPGNQKIDLVHVDDVVGAYLLASRCLIEGAIDMHEIYGVCSEKPISLKELVTMLEEQTGKKMNIKWGGRPYRQREVMVVWSKCKLLKGWKPRKDLKNSLKKMDVK